MRHVGRLRRRSAHLNIVNVRLINGLTASKFMNVNPKFIQPIHDAPDLLLASQQASAWEIATQRWTWSQLAGVQIRSELFL